MVCINSETLNIKSRLIHSMEGVQIKKVRNVHLPDVYTIHESSFPNPASKRYYERLKADKKSPFYVAINDEGDVVGFVATRYERPRPMKEGVLIVSALACDGGTGEGALDEKGINDALLDALMTQVRIGGYSEIQADVRESKTESIELFTDYGFEGKSVGKYTGGETKIRFIYQFDIDVISGDFQLERASYKHLSRVMMLHNEYLKAQKDYAYFSRILRNKGSVFLVVEDGLGRVVGYLAARRQHRKTGDDTTPFTYLNFVSMGVDERARGNRLGQVLVERLIEEAKASDVEVIFGHVREENVAARNLYQKLGFREKYVGNYKDTDEKKYYIQKRIRLPSLRPYLKPTAKNGILIAVGYFIRSLKD